MTKKKNFKSGDIVMIKEKYNKYVSLKPNTRMLVDDLCDQNGNITTIWEDYKGDVFIFYKATFIPEMLQKE